MPLYDPMYMFDTNIRAYKKPNARETIQTTTMPTKARRFVMEAMYLKGNRMAITRSTVTANMFVAEATIDVWPKKLLAEKKMALTSCPPTLTLCTK